MKVEISKELEGIFEEYLESRNEELQEIRAFISKSDFENIQTRGHRLAGNAGGYGLAELGKIGRKLESAAKAEDLNEILILIGQIEGYLKNLEYEYSEK